MCGSVAQSNGFVRQTNWTDSSGTIRALRPSQVANSLKAILEVLALPDRVPVSLEDYAAGAATSAGGFGFGDAK